jgi:hypothetical protein
LPEAGSNTCTVALQVVVGVERGRLESEKVNMVASPIGLEPQNDCAGEDQQQLQTTDPSFRLRERPTSTNPKLSDGNKIMVISPRWGLYSKIDWPTDRRS